MESKDKNKEETSKKDKEYGKKMGRPKIPVRFEKIKRWFL